MLDSMVINNQNLSPENPLVVTHEGVIINAVYSQGFCFGDFNMSRFRRKPPLCKCGCGGRVKKNKQTKKWNRFIVGHNTKLRDKYKKEKAKSPPLCKCGCGMKTTWNYATKQFNDFLPNHHLKNNQHAKGSKRTKEQRKAISKRLKSLKDLHWMKDPKVVKKVLQTKKKTGVLKQYSEAWKNDGNPSKKPEVRKKQSETKRGDLNPAKRPEVRAKISKTLMGRFVGPLSANWRGGLSYEPYCDAWADKDYKESILERDNHTCQNPDCKGKHYHLPLHRHHIDYNKKNCHPWNLITLCVSCHGETCHNRKYWTKFYQNIMAEKYGYEY